MVVVKKLAEVVVQVLLVLHRNGGELTEIVFGENQSITLH